MQISEQHSILIHNAVQMDLPDSEIVLPIDDGLKQSIEIKGSGGSTNYKLLSSNHLVIETHENLAVTSSEGEAFLILTDQLNCMNFDFRKGIIYTLD